MSRLALLGPTDIDWVAGVVDIVESGVGRPWRDALERLDDLQRAEHGDAPRRFSAVVAAVQRLTGGRAKNAAAAREARGIVLGAPALTEAERHARIGAAADELELTPASLEKLLWSDLPRERPVELPGGRPLELEVAAFANVAILQRTFRRAQAITLRTTEDPSAMLRACTRHGLLATATIVDDAVADHTTAAPRGATTEIVIVGPLALFHRTSVYGRALAELVPLLGELRDYELEIHAETPTAMYSTIVESTRDAPILLPDPPARLSAVPYPIAKLARALQRFDLRGQRLAVTSLPPPIVAGTSIICPDILVEWGTRQCYVEIVAFWTAAHVQRKRAAYRAAQLDVILCLAETGAQDESLDDASMSDVLTFRTHADAEEIIGRLEHLWGTLCS